MKTSLPVLLTLLVMQLMMRLPKPEFYHKFQHYIATIIEKSDYGLLIGLSAFIFWLVVYLVIHSFFKHFINNL